MSNKDYLWFTLASVTRLEMTKAIFSESLAYQCCSACGWGLDWGCTCTAVLWRQLQSTRGWASQPSKMMFEFNTLKKRCLFCKARSHRRSQSVFKIPHCFCSQGLWRGQAVKPAPGFSTGYTLALWEGIRDAGEALLLGMGWDGMGLGAAGSTAMCTHMPGLRKKPQHLC